MFFYLGFGALEVHSNPSVINRAIRNKNAQVNPSCVTQVDHVQEIMQTSSSFGHFSYESKTSQSVDCRASSRLKEILLHFFSSKHLAILIPSNII